jgi:hypothetical protein
MQEERQQKWVRGTRPFLPEGEHLVDAFWGQAIAPAWIYALVGVPLLLTMAGKGRIVVLTNRHVWVFAAKPGKTYEPEVALLRQPRETASARVAGRAFPGRRLEIGDQRVYLRANRRVQELAARIASLQSASVAA